MSRNKHDFSSSDSDAEQDNLMVVDEEEQEEDRYFEPNNSDIFITETTMITNTDLYAFASEFMEYIENQTFLWPVPMLKVIKFLSDKSIEFSKMDIPEQGSRNYQQLYNEVNLVMVMLMMKVPIQLDIVVGSKIIDLNKPRQISYKKQPFHEPLIILEILLEKGKISRDEIIDEVLPLLNQ